MCCIVSASWQCPTSATNNDRSSFSTAKRSMPCSPFRTPPVGWAVGIEPFFWLVFRQVSELIGLNCQDIVLGTGAHVRCLGKGRKQRCTPLRPETARALEVWLRERHGLPENPAFPSVRGGRLSRDAVERLITKYTHCAEHDCPSLKRKNVSPHVMRHSSAMNLLHHGVDRSVIALWLGHESPETTRIYLHADMRLKEKALSRIEPLGGKLVRYHPDDQLLTFLERL